MPDEEIPRNMLACQVLQVWPQTYPFDWKEEKKLSAFLCTV